MYQILFSIIQDILKTKIIKGLRTQFEVDGDSIAGLSNIKEYEKENEYYKNKAKILKQDENNRYNVLKTTTNILRIPNLFKF